MAPGRPAYRPPVPALCALYDQPQRTPGEDPANPHISAEHPQQLELPLLITTNILWTFEYDISSCYQYLCQLQLLSHSSSYKAKLRHPYNRKKQRCGLNTSGIPPLTHIICLWRMGQQLSAVHFYDNVPEWPCWVEKSTYYSIWLMLLKARAEINLERTLFKDMELERERWREYYSLFWLLVVRFMLKWRWFCGTIS